MRAKGRESRSCFEGVVSSGRLATETQRSQWNEESSFVGGEGTGVREGLQEPGFPLWELLGYTPGVLAKSAEAIEKRGDEIFFLARERKNGARASEKAVEGYRHPRAFCMNIKIKGMRVEQFA